MRSSPPLSRRACPSSFCRWCRAANRQGAVDQIPRIEAQLPRRVEIWLGGGDAVEVARDLGRSRVGVLQNVSDIETEIQRVAEAAGDALQIRGRRNRFGMARFDRRHAMDPRTEYLRQFGAA
jgi:hypothetical protein